MIPLREPLCLPSLGAGDRQGTFHQTDFMLSTQNSDVSDASNLTIVTKAAALGVGADSGAACRDSGGRSKGTEAAKGSGDAKAAESPGGDDFSAELGLLNEVERLTLALTDKFEEISLIHDFTERLKLDEDAATICEELLQQLSGCFASSSMAISLVADEESGFQAMARQVGEPLSEHTIACTSAAVQDVMIRHAGEPFVLGAAVVNESTEPALVGKRVVVVPIERHQTRLGTLLALRKDGDPEFGTIEVDLIKSTLMLLGVHLINHRQYLAMQQMFEGTVHSLVSALDAKDAYTCGHSSRVAELAVELAKRLEFDEDQIDTIRMAGILHDIGKIGVEDSVLRKPGKLTDEEFDKIKQHPVLGYEILKGIRPFRTILPAVRHHHESWDGHGYPDGLRGDAIPRHAQLLAVADAFDAMTSDRPYRKGMPVEKVKRIFAEGRGIQWAADVVDALLSSDEMMQEFSERQYNMSAKTGPLTLPVQPAGVVRQSIVRD